MSNTLCVAALLWALAGPAFALSLEDAPLPAAISLVRDNGILTFRDDNGHSLYLYNRDKDGHSKCEGPCASEWPPVAAPSDAHPIGDWMPIRRADGSLQWAYKGQPVYTFRGDTAAGQSTGAGKRGGGVWRLLAPSSSQ